MLVYAKLETPYQKLGHKDNKLFTTKEHNNKEAYRKIPKYSDTPDKLL